MLSLQSEEFANICSKATIAVCLVIISAGIFSLAPLHMGEHCSTMLTTISLEKHLSMFVFPSDIAQAKRDYPGFAADWEKPRLFTASAQEGNPYGVKMYGAPVGEGAVLHSYYFGTYSFFCIPMKKILCFLGLNQAYAFAITNALLYLLALIIVYAKSKSPRQIVFITILLLTCNPALFMILWASVEIFIFSFIVISLVFLCNRDYKKSALFASIASTVNPSICIYLVVIASLYIISESKRHLPLSREKSGLRGWIKNIVRFKTKDAIACLSCFLPALFPFIYNLNFFHKLNPLATYHTSTLTGDYLLRFCAYLFDLNFGFLPYQPVVIVFFFALLLGAIYKRNLYAMFFSVAFLGTVAAFSFAFHINCGMSYISRYGSWSLPLAIFFVTDQFQRIIASRRIRRFIKGALILSAFYTAILLGWYYETINFNDYATMLPVAAKMLDSFPSFYNPYPATFVSRVNHVDGGYTDFPPESVVYLSTKDSSVKKILTTPAAAKNLRNAFFGSPADLVYLNKFLSNKALTPNSFYYINFDKQHIYRKSDIPFMVDAKNTAKISPAWLGVYPNEKEFSWTTDNVKIVLRPDSIKSAGLRIEYALCDLLFIANHGKKIRVDIFLNEVLLKSESFSRPCKKTLLIDAKDLPSATEGIYFFRIRSSAFFCPARMTKVFGSDYKDERKLSLQLNYVGPQREIAKQLDVQHFESFADGIDFRRSNLPDFVSEIKGLSGREVWGRWSDKRLNRSIKIKFSAPLPRSFTLILRAQPYGPNAGVPVQIRVGDQITTVIFLGGIEEKSVRIATAKPTFEIEIIPSFAVSPLSQGISADGRELGIGLERIWVEAN